MVRLIPILVTLMVFTLPTPLTQPSSIASPDSIEPQTLDKGTSTVFYVKIPVKQGLKLQPLVSDKLEPLSKLVEKADSPVIAAINAGYFDPKNKKTISYVIEQGHISANPLDNDRFINNPNLQPFLPKMLNRSEFRIVRCCNQLHYSITNHDTPVSPNCQIVHSIQAGPNLLDANALENEGFTHFENQQLVRDAIGYKRKNARSAIGIDNEGNIILAIARMKALGKAVPSGVTLAEMATIMTELGAVQALSMDGGSSSSLWVNGTSYYGKLDASGHVVKRPIKSALVVTQTQEKDPYD